MKLSEATHDFWVVSIAYHKRKEGTGITTGDALNLLTAHLDNGTGTSRLWLRVFNLREGIIQGNVKKHG